MKIVASSLAPAILLGIGFVFGHWIQPLCDPGPRASLQITESGPTVEHLQELQYLTTLQDALVTEIRGRVGTVRAILVVYGRATIGVDLSRARFEQLDLVRRTGQLHLPTPRLESSGLDQDKTKVVALFQTGLWMFAPGQGEADAVATNSALWQIQQVLLAAGQDPDGIRLARQQAERVLIAFFSEMNWKISVQWNDH
jgi:hypothetical protein